jgi:hypothetical protein
MLVHGWPGNIRHLAGQVAPDPGVVGGWAYRVRKSAIMAMSSCSRLWQCSMKRPG